MIIFLHALIFIFCLSCISFILAKASLFTDIKYNLIKKFRKHETIEKYLIDFLYCPMCIGFWVGFLGEIYSGIFNHIYGIIGYILSGAVTAVVALIIDRILNPTEE